MLVKTLIGAAMQLTSPVHSADWQFTQWDMSQAQVLAASKGSLTAYSNPSHDRGDSKAKLAGTYSAGGFDFTAILSFDLEDHLTYVELDPLHPGQCDDLLQKLQRNYGLPATRTEAGMDWVDAPNRNKIFMFYVETTCSVTYSPLNRAGAGGL